MHGRVWISTLLGVLVCVAVSRSATLSAPTLQVMSCYAASDYAGAGILVDFRNRSPIGYRTIVWRASFSLRSVDFIEPGRFNPGAESRQAVWRSREQAEPPMYDSMTGRCQAIEAQQDDGEVWKASTIADAPAIAGTPLPDPLPTARADTAEPIPATFDNPLHDPVGIVACNFGFDSFRRRGYGAMNVRFRNLSSKTISRVVFRGLFGDGGVDFVFGGTFAPGVLISSNQWGNAIVGKIPRLVRTDLGRNLPSDYNDIDDNPMNCATVTAQYADGTVWQNPTLPQSVPLPTPFPAASTAP